MRSAHIHHQANLEWKQILRNPTFESFFRRKPRVIFITDEDNDSCDIGSSTDDVDGNDGEAAGVVATLEDRRQDVVRNVGPCQSSKVIGNVLVSILKPSPGVSPVRRFLTIRRFFLTTVASAITNHSCYSTTLARKWTAKRKIMSALIFFNAYHPRKRLYGIWVFVFNSECHRVAILSVWGPRRDNSIFSGGLWPCLTLSVLIYPPCNDPDTSIPLRPVPSWGVWSWSKKTSFKLVHSSNWKRALSSVLKEAL